MTQAVIIAKIDTKIKEQAQALAKSFGLNLSSLINVQLRNFIKTKKLTIGEVDDTHWSYYENNPDYLDVNVSAEEFIKTLEKHIKKDGGSNKVR